MAYARLSTRIPAGLHPNLRGLGQVPLTTMSIGPGGQFAISTATTPTSTSLWDQMLSWLGSSTIVAGMPNSIFAIGAVVVGFGLLRRRR